MVVSEGRCCFSAEIGEIVCAPLTPALVPRWWPTRVGPPASYLPLPKWVKKGEKDKKAKKDKTGKKDKKDKKEKKELGGVKKSKKEKKDNDPPVLAAVPYRCSSQSD